MLTFSDIPEFILDEYLDAITASPSAAQITGTYTYWEDIQFTDTTSVNFTNTNFVHWNIEYTTGDKANHVKSFITRPQHTFVTKGGNNLIDVYVKEDENYQEIKLSPLATNLKYPDEYSPGSFYNFKILNNIYPVPSDTISYTLSAASSGAQSYLKYKFIQYDCFSSENYKTIEEKNGTNVYFRKNGVFQQWGKENYPYHINYNIDYLFIGQVYPYQQLEWYCKIFRFVYKDFISSMLPENNRTDNLMEFLNTCFDNPFTKVYKQQKNLKTLYDPFEMNTEYINRLTSGLYDINTDLYNTDNEDRLRDLAENMPILIKKKGTYSSLIGIWKFVTGFDSSIDNRDVNIYEWWHDTLDSVNLSGSDAYTVPLSGYEEINYVNSYATSASTIDFTGCSGDSYYKRYVNTYPDFYSTNLYPIVNNSYIHKQQTNSLTWDVKHWINEKELLVQCFNENYEEIVPAEVYIKDSSIVKITFTEAVKGYCVICKVNYGELQKGSYWSIDHYINHRNVLSQSFNTFNERFSPINVYKENYDTELITVNENDGWGYFLKGDYIYHNRTEQSIWTVEHYLNALLLVQCYDEDHNQIVPSKIEQNDLNELTITFNENTKGYVILKRIGNPFAGVSIGKILSPHYKIEFDLTCKPIDETEIFSESTAQNLFDNLESVRTIDRVAHYHCVFSPKTDFSTNTIGTYDKKYDAHCLTKFTHVSGLDDVGVYSQSTSATEWNITHGVKADDILVFVYDLDYNLIEPQSIDIVSNTNVVIYFDDLTPQAGYALIVKSESTKLIYDYDVNIAHSWNRNIISQFYTLNNDERIFPSTIINNSNSLFVEGSEDGFAYLVEGNYFWTQSTSATEWNINHNYGTNGVIVEYFDNSWNKIVPESFTLTDSNNCKATFYTPINGYAVVIDIGYINYKEDIMSDLLTNGAVVYIGDGSNKNYMLSESISGALNITNSFNINTDDIYKYGQDLCIDINIPTDITEEYDIREICIYNYDETKLYFYTQCSQLYKNKDYTMTIHYYVSYDNI